MSNPLTEGTSSESDVGDGHYDELFEVLSHRLRRFMLQHLLWTETPVPVEELTSELVKAELDRPVADREGSDSDAIEISLKHNHLPKMAEAGLIGYDSTQQKVTLADRTEEARSQLKAMALD